MTSFILRRRGRDKSYTEAISALSTKGLGVVTDHRLPREQADVVFRWGGATPVNAVTEVNTPRAIGLAGHKSAFRRLLRDRFPETIPNTYFSPNDLQYPLRTPVVVRKGHHQQGLNLHLAENEAAVRASCALYADFYISDYIPKVAEYRIFFLQGRVVWVAKKTPADPEAIAWNVEQGGRFDNVRWDEWPIGCMENSYKAFTASGLDFGSVDVMVDREGRTYVLEINTASSITSPYRQSATAKAFDFVLDNGKEALPITRFRKYKDVIHPALVIGE